MLADRIDRRIDLNHRCGQCESGRWAHDIGRRRHRTRPVARFRNRAPRTFPRPVPHGTKHRHRTIHNAVRRCSRDECTETLRRGDDGLFKIIGRPPPAWRQSRHRGHICSSGPWVLDSGPIGFIEIKTSDSVEPSHFVSVTRHGAQHVDSLRNGGRPPNAANAIGAGDTATVTVAFRPPESLFQRPGELVGCTPSGYGD
jgi:hypothetical protein